VIEKWCDGWYLFGAQAVIVWGRPRLTADVDITIRLRVDDAAGFCQDMQKVDFQLRVADRDSFLAVRGPTFSARPHAIAVGCRTSGPGIEETFIRRAVPIDIEGLTVPVVSREHLIVMKILAGRPKDLEDLRTVLAEQSATLDIDYIRSTLGFLEQALGQSDLLPVLKVEITRADRLRR